MKTFRSPIALAVVLGLTTFGAAFAANTANSQADAEIVPAIAITNVTGLQFGQIAPSGVAGTVTISTGGVRSSLGGVTLGNLTAVTAASFNVTGAPSNTYSITLPASIVITNVATDTMTVDTFLSNPAVGTGGTLSGAGAQTLTVGATLHVGINQPVGNYNGNFDVTVDYN